MNIYISGPFTGVENENRPEFERVKRNLEGCGNFVAAPHEVVEIDEGWHRAMYKSIRRMLCLWSYAKEYEEKMGVAMLDGWEDSKGARIEHDLAEALGIPCKPWREYL